MVLDGGIRPHRRRDCSGRMVSQRAPGYPGMADKRRRPGAALAPRPRGSTALEGWLGVIIAWRVYAGNRDGVPRRVESKLEMYAQRRQANTEMRRGFGHPGEVVSQVVNAQRSGQ